MSIQKSFPADTTLKKEVTTFLSDSKIDAELYAYLLSQSIGEEKETRVYKKDLPARKDIAKILKRKSKTTIDNHFNYLKEKFYLEEYKDYYKINIPERMYFKMPLELVQLFVSTIKPHVLKIYIYLGQRNNYKPNQYVFTIKELCEHLGLNYKYQSTAVADSLLVLEKLGLIKTVKFYNGRIPQRKLVDFSTSISED